MKTNWGDSKSILGRGISTDSFDDVRHQIWQQVGDPVWEYFQQNRR